MCCKKLIINLSVCFLNSFSANIFAQQKELDSLLRLNAAYAKEDSFKAKLLDNIVGAYNNISLDAAMRYAEKEIAVANRLQNKKYLAQAYESEGNIFESKSAFFKALECFQNELLIDQDLRDMRAISLADFSIGNLFLILANDSSALIYLNKGLGVVQNLPDSISAASFMIMIGLAYSRLHNCDKALEYCRKALSIFNNNGDKNKTGEAFNALGTICVQCENLKEGLIYFQKSLGVYREMTERKDISIPEYITQELSNMSHTSLKLKNYRLALQYAKEALQINRSTGNKVDAAVNYFDVSNIYFERKQYNQAIDFAGHSKYLAELTGSLRSRKKALQMLSDSYAAIKQYNKAYEYYKQYIIAKDSINNSEELKKINQLQLQYEFNKESDSISAQQKLKDTKIKQQQSLSKLQLKQQWFFSIGILILVASLSFWLIYRNRMKQQKLKMELAKEKAIQEKKEAEFQRSLADVSLTALRSQMNPHFIFNCLNSIKLYTTQNDTQAASDYLTKFSKLIRLVMENSRNDKISFGSEIDALRLYIEMEAMRFKEKLIYSISVDPNVEIDYIEIPPLLLQPYVENAIWHGLMHKEEGGKIDISAHMQKDESLLEINIADNGIGRTKATELRSKNATKHKSYGMKVTSERIALINKIYKTGASVTVHDLFDETGIPTGTKVTILIPV